MDTMTPAQQSLPSAPTRRRRLVRAVAALLAVLAVLAGVGIWWFFKEDAPPAVELITATAQLDDEAVETDTDFNASDPAATDSGAATSTESAAVGSATVTPGDIDGDWTVDTSVGQFNYDDSTGTFVGFRVEEELRGIGSTTAVGRTPEVNGTVTIEGATVISVTIEADMAALTTNDGRRDDQVRGALDTSRYPTATFTLTEPIDLGTGAAEGEPVTTNARGELTIHGVTNAVEISIDAQLVEGTIVIVGSLEIVFADYDVTVPGAPIVVSAEDHGVVELQLFLNRA